MEGLQVCYIEIYSEGENRIVQRDKDGGEEKGASER